MRYIPLTPVLSIAFTVVARPLASVKTSGVLDGISRPRVTRIPRTPSLLSVSVTRASRACRRVIRSMLRQPAPPRKTNIVCSRRTTLPSPATQSMSVSSTPWSGPPRSAVTALCTTVPIFWRSSGLIASELFQKSKPFTSP